jgi:hypothetical protein
MHDQRSPDVAADEARIDSAILALLLDDDAQRPWSVDEVAREIGDPLATSDAVARLYGAGLVHRLEGFVFATRPALRAARLAG